MSTRRSEKRLSCLWVSRGHEGNTFMTGAYDGQDTAKNALKYGAEYTGLILMLQK